MKANIITEGEIAALKVSSLPSRPTAPGSFGGLGYTAGQMKAAFDRLPLYIIERLNDLIDGITRTGDGSFAAAMPTGIKEGHTLRDLIEDIVNGNCSAYLTVLGEPLGGILARHEEKLAGFSGGGSGGGSSAIDCGSPEERMSGGDE